MNDQPPAATDTPDAEPLRSHAQVEGIAAQLERDTRCTVNRAELAADLEFEIEQFRLLMSALPGIRKVRSEHREMLERAYHLYRQFRSSLEELSGGGLISDAPTILGCAGRIDQELALRLREACANAPHRGQPSNKNVRANFYRYSLAQIYEHHTGRRAGTSTIRDRHGGERRRGPFVIFVEMVMDIAEPSVQRTALGTSVAEALRGRRVK